MTIVSGKAYHIDAADGNKLRVKPDRIKHSQILINISCTQVGQQRDPLSMFSFKELCKFTLHILSRDRIKHYSQTFSWPKGHSAISITDTANRRLFTRQFLPKLDPLHSWLLPHEKSLASQSLKRLRLRNSLLSRDTVRSTQAHTHCGKASSCCGWREPHF